MAFRERASFFQILIVILIFLIFNPSYADIHGRLTGTTNYLGRGYSKSQDDFAIQAKLDYQHPSGIYLGTSVSNVNFGHRRSNGESTDPDDRNFTDPANVEFTPYFGYTHKLTDDWRADIQWTRYIYDGKIFGQQADYNEFYLFLHYRDLVTLRASISDSFYGRNVISGDYELTVRYPLTQYLEVSSGFGYLQAENVLKWDYIYWNAGITARYKFIMADLRYVQSEWNTPRVRTLRSFDLDLLEPSVVFSLSVGF